MPPAGKMAKDRLGEGTQWNEPGTGSTKESNFPIAEHIPSMSPSYTADGWDL
ncbi:hypothetical protein HPP92_014086, partial [Vanilla planifolia]